MKHKNLMRMISEYVDGHLPAEKAQMVRLHIKNCEQCRIIHQQFLALHKPEFQVAMTVRPFFTQRVLNEYHRRNDDKIWQIFDVIPRRFITVGLALSLILVVFIASPLFYSPSKSYDPGLSLLFNNETEISTVTDDEALAIALSAELLTLDGE